MCAGVAVKLTKTVDSVTGLTLVDPPPNPLNQTYEFDVGYTIAIENVGTDPLPVESVQDLLPEGFTYNLGSTLGDIIVNPSEHLVNQADRWRLTWDLDPDLLIPSETTATVQFHATATVSRGDFWNDVLLSIDDAEFTEPVYSWPTAVVTVREAFDIEATDEDGDTISISIQVVVGTESGTIALWNMN